MKKYNSPMLQVVSINKKDIIVTSDLSMRGDYSGSVTIAAPGQRALDGWDAGY